MPSYKLIYFNLRARAEVPRIIMAYGGIDYEDVRLTQEEWQKVKSTTPFGQLPVLEVDGHKICQGDAISRFLAKKAGLNGKSDIDEAKIDMVIGCMQDSFKKMATLFSEKDEARKAEIFKAAQDSMEETLKKIESLIEGDFFIGNEITWADIAVAEGLLFPPVMGFNMPMDKVPKLAALKDRVMNHPKIAPWIAKRPETKF